MLELEKILNTKNIVELLEDDEKTKIASQVTERFNDDAQSRKDKQNKLKDIVQLALSITEGKAFPWENASNVIYPLISTAIIEFSAKCSPEILRDDAIVKSKVIGKDEGKPAYNVAGEMMKDEQTGLPLMKDAFAKQKRGERVATFMNYQLSEEIENWQDDTDKLIVSLGACGTMFRKTYQGLNGLESEIVYPDKLIVHDKTTKFNKAPITHLIELYENEIQERIRKGFFVEFDYMAEGGDSVQSLGVNDLSNAQDESAGSDINSGLHIFLEQCCWLDLDGDEFLEPYVATLHMGSNQLVRLVPRFKKKDVKKEGDKIVSIKAKNPYTPYIFLPSPDGSFYGIGLGHLLLNLNQSSNTAINQLTDAATLQNTGGGFIAKSLKVAGGKFSMRPNEYKMVDSFGGSIRDSIVPLPTPQPSQTSFALLGFLVQSGKELASLRDVLTGENAANVQATTMMTMVEQGMTQFKSVYKRIFRALKKEFKNIYEINGEYLSNEHYAEVIDENALNVDVKADFSLKGFDIVPVADVSSVTNSQRMAKASFLMQFLNDPYTNQMLLRQEIMAGFNIENYQDLIVAPPPQQPSVEQILAQAEMLKGQVRQMEAQIKALDTAARLDNAKYDSEKVLADIAETKTRAIKNIADAVSQGNQDYLKEVETISRDVERKSNQQLKQNESKANMAEQSSEKETGEQESAETEE